MKLTIARATGLSRLALLLCVSVLVAGLVSTSALPAFAAGGQAGAITGTILDSTTQAPISGATVSAAAPTGTYSTKTDARGFFSLLGVIVDTYTLSIQAPGYEPVSESAVTVSGDQTLSLGSIRLTKTLRTIGRVSARSRSSVFQPNQTVDSYSVTGERILQTTGKAASTNERSLALAVPGVTLTSSNGITIRGGLRTEVGYQYDGVDFTEPFFAQSASNNRFNGIGSLQIVEGAGDATQGNIGGGVVNLIPKRGSNPPFGFVDFEAGAPNYFHQFAIEYGFASPNGRFSDYIAYTGQREVPYYGARGADAAGYDNYYGVSFESNDDLVNNFVYKFGKTQNQSLQILYLNRNLQQWGNLGGIVSGYPNGTPPGVTSQYPFVTSWYPVDATNPLGGSASPLNSVWPNYANLIGLNPGVPSNYTQIPTSPELTGWNPTRYLKFEYDNSLNATTFVTAKYYNWETLQGSSNNTGSTFSNFGNLGLGSYPTWNETGGPKVGGIVDITHQFSSKHTLTLDGKYENSHPIWNGYDPNALTFLMGFGFGGPNGPLYSDFLPGGYLQQFFPNGVPRIPISGINYNGTNFQQYGVGIREQYAPNDKLKADIGLRYDGQKQHYGINPLNPFEPGNPSDVDPSTITAKYVNPTEVEPRLAVSYQTDPNNSFRFGYGKSVVFLVAQDAGTPAGLFNYAPFLNVPPKMPAAGSSGPAFACGSGGHNPNFTPPCQNYAQQLYWLYDQFFDAPDLGGALPALYENYDITYQHQFRNGVGMRITPFYKNGTNLLSFALITGLAAGAAVFEVNNKGINHTTGVEFGLTTPDRATGFTGFLSATYQNVIGSTPPLIGGEDALPINGSGSLGLNDTYRAGYVSPFSVRVGGDYKTKWGLRVNPVLQYDRGYPFNVGDLIASGSPVFNGMFLNIPQVNFGPGVTAVPGFQSQSGATNSTNYYDPAYPGNSLNPNIAGTRGTPSTPSSGGALYKPNLQANLVVELKRQRNTFGVAINNLFGNQYNNVIPTINPYYQPVATGLSGPTTGVNPNAVLEPSRGFANVPKELYAYTNGAYLLVPTYGYGPTSFTFYYQLGL